jgi:hypothetical protein
MAASLSLLAIPLATSASAAQPAACKKLSSKVVAKKTVTTISSCTPTAATGGSGTTAYTTPPKGSKAGSLKLTITWASKHGTSVAVIQFTQQKTLGKCPKGKTNGSAWTRDKITGSISGGSGTAFKTIKKGQAVTGSVCNAKALSVEPNTTLKF